MVGIVLPWLLVDRSRQACTSSHVERIVRKGYHIDDFLLRVFVAPQYFFWVLRRSGRSTTRLLWMAVVQTSVEQPPIFNERLGKMLQQVRRLLASPERVKLGQESHYHAFDDIIADEFFWIGHQDRAIPDDGYLCRLFETLKNLLTACT